MFLQVGWFNFNERETLMLILEEKVWLDEEPVQQKVKLVKMDFII